MALARGASRRVWRLKTDPIPADPRDWRPQVVDSTRGTFLVENAIAEPIWSGTRVLAFFREAENDDEWGSVEVIDEAGDDAADSAPRAFDQLRRSIAAREAVVDGIVTAQTLDEGVSMEFDPTRPTAGKDLAFVVARPAAYRSPATFRCTAARAQAPARGRDPAEPAGAHVAVDHAANPRLAADMAHVRLQGGHSQGREQPLRARFDDRPSGRSWRPPDDSLAGWPLVVRVRGQATRRPVLAFATKTWNGWDYMPHAWHALARANDGVLLVGAGRADGARDVDDRHSSRLGRWPSCASRCRPPARRGWKASVSIHASVAWTLPRTCRWPSLHWAAANGARIVRYATSARNEGSHRLGARGGLVLIARSCTRSES